MIDDAEVGGGAGDGVASVAADDESGVDLGGAGGCCDLDSDDARELTGGALCFDEAGDFVLHEEMEVWELRCLPGDEVEKIPLGHEGDEVCVGGEVGEIDYGERLVAEGDGEFTDLAVAEGEEGVEEA